MKKFAAILIVLFSFFFFSGQTEAKGEGQLIIINKANNKLAYYNEGKLVKTFKVATGRKRSYTPEGKFKIVTKIVNRPYYKENIPGGHPRNPLGDRWMGINARGTYGTTYAIHGNNNPSSIGTYASSGCIRMYDNDVRWLYSQVKNNTPVIITHSSQSFDAIAASNGYVPKSKIGKVTVSKPSPQLKNTILTINAGASTGYSPSFNYSVYDGKKWSTIKNYSASKSVQWKPTKPGTYKLKVEVKSKHSKNTFDDQKIINYNIYEAASMKSVKTDKASPQLKNTNISVSAISNNNANNLFQYSYSTDGKKWTTIKKYSSAAKVNWKPAAPGQYKIKVQVKHKWSKKVFDHEQTISYNIYDEAVLTSFTTDKDKESTQPVHTDITFFANSTNNANNLFEYSYSTDGGEKWTTIKNYSTSTEINWKPDTPGKYKIRVQIKHKLSNKIQGTLDIDFNILSLAELTGDTSVTGRLERNAQVEITANGTEEDGTG